MPDLKNAMVINNWSISPSFSGIPGRFVLYGSIGQHRNLGNTQGRPIRTSWIVWNEGLLVRTFSGSLYILGEPAQGDEVYAEMGVPIGPDPLNPLAEFKFMEEAA